MGRVGWFLALLPGACYWEAGDSISGGAVSFLVLHGILAPAAGPAGTAAVRERAQLPLSSTVLVETLTGEVFDGGDHFSTTPTNARACGGSDQAFLTWIGWSWMSRRSLARSVRSSRR